MNDTTSATPMSPRWCVLEKFGHVRLIGRVSEVDLFGRRMGLIEVPREDGTFESHHFSGESVFGLTETTEEKVRAELARRWEDQRRWAAPALAPFDPTPDAEVLGSSEYFPGDDDR